MVIVDVEEERGEDSRPDLFAFFLLRSITYFVARLCTLVLTKAEPKATQPNISQL